MDIGSVLFAGFAVAFLLGVGLYYVLNMWRGTKETGQFEKQIRMEQNERLVRLNTLTTEIQHLESHLDTINQEKTAHEKQVEELFKQQLDARIAAHKHPIEVKIVRLNTEKEHLQGHLDKLNERVEALQKEINRCEAEIETLSDKASNQLIDIKKLEAQANEFVSGWCRYVAQSKTELTDDISTQIRHIQHFANETLEAFKTSLTAN